VDGITAAGKTIWAGKLTGALRARGGGRADLSVRYHAACALYMEESDPVRRASIVIDNNDLDHPVLRRIG
jgi:hypothetical protein